MCTVHLQFVEYSVLVISALRLCALVVEEVKALNKFKLFFFSETACYVLLLVTFYVRYYNIK